MRVHPKPEATIPISLAVRHLLIGGSAATGWDKEDWEIAEEAINEWTRRHNPDALAASAMTGYQWKSQFLPDGTVLRTVFNGKNHHCRVEDDRILYKEKAVSPSGFVNAVGGIRRNAWRCTWILFPDSKEWRLADSLRTRQRPPRTHRPQSGLQQAPPAQPAAVQAPVTVPRATGFSAAQPDPIAASASQASNSQHAVGEQVPASHGSGEGRTRQRRAGIALPLPAGPFGTERRTNRDDRTAALLRQELLPLLYRLCAASAMAPETPLAPYA